MGVDIAEMVSRITIYFRIWFTVGFKRIALSCLKILGLLWVPFQPASLFFPHLFSPNNQQNQNYGWYGYVGFVLVSLLIAIIANLPRRVISQRLSSPDVTIEIKVGDLF